jgi:hypothetical protein
LRTKERTRTEPQHRQHQRELASPLVGHRPGDRASHQTHDQRHRSERAGQRTIDSEALLNVDQDEGEDVEVERIDDPAQKDGPERTPLVRCDLPVPGTVARLILGARAGVCGSLSSHVARF